MYEDTDLENWKANGVKKKLKNDSEGPTQGTIVVGLHT